jgi:glycosyltransferase involved in cell wall biosynthesis
MKVLMANKFFFLNGGSETVFFQERDFLRDSGVEVLDFAMHDERNLQSPNASYFVGSRQYRNKGGVFQKIKAATSLIHSPEAVKNITALIEAEHPDIVHCHNIYHQLTPSIIGAAHKLGVPVVLTLHDYKPVCPIYVRSRDGSVCSDCLQGDFINVVKHRCAEGSLGKSAVLYAEATVQRILGNYEKVAKVIAPSRFMAHSAASRFPSESVEVIYNGIDLDTVSASGEDGNYALYLGRLSHEKGVATLLEAYRRNEIRLPLKVCGTGPLMEDLSGNAPANVEFLGYQSGDALQAIIRSASMIVVPSEWYENCPMSILEAMAYGKPVVGARIGGIPELVADGETGFLHESGNVADLAGCIKRLADNETLRGQMGRAARQRVEEQFSLKSHNAALMQVYQKLLEN